ncbi:sulfurtransferase [Halogeometricum limi]|uniref:Thiosulfate/3-mercaptopyruvate sulfurtransferase n=1 Tax=Halogeometricum limi TaxID=555875 RepID=A0A1I6FRE3_9EURY|nr:rhodanese-like domain-containing protein [Halogeometricum limi]SFR32530.1 thiosulfate/3-mercaptopyruvate sulfurtransferase [Halogeometricum limi]
MYEDIVVSPAWVEERRDELRLVDVRDAWEFDGIGHVPGAVNVPFDEFRASGDDESDGESADGRENDGDDGVGMLPGEDVWESLLSAAGVGSDDHLVAYDDTHGVFAARFLVTAELYGHPADRLHLLDGDYSSWNRDHETTTEATEVSETAYEVREPERTPLVDYEFVLDSLDDEESVVVDTREAWEFEEGHLPGAVNLDWRELVDDDTRGLKSPDELEAALESVGVTPEKRVVLYCNTARRISHTYVVLRFLGYEDVAFYEGSLTEWEKRGGPIEMA